MGMPPAKGIRVANRPRPTATVPAMTAKTLALTKGWGGQDFAQSRLLDEDDNQGQGRERGRGDQDFAPRGGQNWGQGGAQSGRGYGSSNYRSQTGGSYGQSASDDGRSGGWQDRSYGEPLRDDVNDHLSDDPSVDASDIEVSVAEGEVTLNGEVSSRQAKRAAEDCVDRIAGVKHVQNNLRVKAQSSAPMSPLGGM